MTVQLNTSKGQQTQDLHKLTEALKILGGMIIALNYYPSEQNHYLITISGTTMGELKFYKTGLDIEFVS